MINWYIISSLFIIFISSILLLRNLKRSQKIKLKSLRDKTVLITGAGNGLGREICLALARECCHLICVDVNQDGNLETKQQIAEINSDLKVLTIECDVSDKKLVKEMAKKVFEQFTTVDILINNAGVLFPSRLHNYTDEHIQRIIHVNLLSHFWTIREFLPKMIEQNDGFIVATSSMAGEMGFETLIPYCASKFGVTGLMESLTHELMEMKTNIKTLTIYPAFMSTTLLPQKIRSPGFKRVNSALLYVVDPKDLANDIVDAIKLEKRQIHAPYIYGLALHIGKFLLPDCLMDIIRTRVLKFNPHIDNLAPC